MTRTLETFGTQPADLARLATWLTAAGVTAVALESTGELWKPVYFALEPAFTVLLFNPQHIKALRGRKTDRKDAEWIADLLRHGLVRASFVARPEERELRALVRERANFVATRATLVNRIHKQLAAAGVSLTGLLSDVQSQAGRQIVRALATGVTDPGALKLRAPVRAQAARVAAVLTQPVPAATRFLLGVLLDQVESLDATIARCEAVIEEAIAAHPDEARAVEWIDSVPGFGRAAAQGLLAEIGPDMSRFPTVGHMAAWVGVAPGNNESAGKRRAAPARQGNQWAKSLLVQCARSAIRAKDSRLGRRYARLRLRLGHRRALVAIAHQLIKLVYWVLVHQEPYQERALQEDPERRETEARRLQRKLAKLGYEVTVTARPAAA